MEYEYFEPLPATLDMILLYIVHMAKRLKYSSIRNYLSAVWVLHDVSGCPHVESDHFEIMVTMKGVKRTLGDKTEEARPATLGDLLAIFSKLDMGKMEDLAFWVAVLMGFRGLLRKSNMLEVDLAVKKSDVRWCTWGVGVVVRGTKTICFKERELFIPFVPIVGSVFCLYFYLSMLWAMIDYPEGDSQLVGYMKGGRYVRATYSWYSRKLSNLCNVLNLEKLSSHSMRRGGASLLAENGVSLIDIKNLGDWRSMSVLFYLTRTLDSKIKLDRRIVKDIFQNPEAYT